MARHKTIPTDRGLWPMLALLVIVVIVPTGGVLWFMGQAIQNVRLAVRQRLIDVYSAHLDAAQARLNAWWQEKEAAINEISAEGAVGEVFARLDACTPGETILASNTSSLPITQLAGGVGRPERVVGSHFVQPGHIVPVVEVIGGERTTAEVVERTCAIWRGLRKMPLRVRRDVPGFLVNRLQHALIREAVSLLAQGVADAEDIDAAVALGLAPRFTTAGPLEQRDINGLGMHVRVARYLWKQLGDGWQEPLAYLEGMVERGELGLEAGKGYYDWTDKDPDAVRREKDELLMRRTKDVMGPEDP